MYAQCQYIKAVESLKAPYVHRNWNVGCPKLP